MHEGAVACERIHVLKDGADAHGSERIQVALAHVRVRVEIVQHTRGRCARRLGQEHHLLLRCALAVVGEPFAGLPERLGDR